MTLADFTYAIAAILALGLLIIATVATVRWWDNRRHPFPTQADWLNDTPSDAWPAVQDPWAADAPSYTWADYMYDRACTAAAAGWDEDKYPTDPEPSIFQGLAEEMLLPSDTRSWRMHFGDVPSDKEIEAALHRIPAQRDAT